MSNLLEKQYVDAMVQVRAEALKLLIDIAEAQVIRAEHDGEPDPYGAVPMVKDAIELARKCSLEWKGKP
jgi:hypothetical protein